MLCNQTWPLSGWFGWGIRLRIGTINLCLVSSACSVFGWWKKSRDVERWERSRDYRFENPSGPRPIWSECLPFRHLRDKRRNSRGEKRRSRSEGNIDEPTRVCRGRTGAKVGQEEVAPRRGIHQNSLSVRWPFKFLFSARITLSSSSVRREEAAESDETSKPSMRAIVARTRSEFSVLISSRAIHYYHLKMASNAKMRRFCRVRCESRRGEDQVQAQGHSLGISQKSLSHSPPLWSLARTLQVHLH